MGWNPLIGLLEFIGRFTGPGGTGEGDAANNDAVYLSFGLEDEGDWPTDAERVDAAKIEELLERAVTRHRVGEWTGHGSGVGMIDIDFGGPDGDKLLDVILRTLATIPHPGGKAEIWTPASRGGSDEEPRRRVEIPANPPPAVK